MAYSELTKSFERIRRYMREFYVYGFRTRDEFTDKSARSYDNERRRLESLLGDYTASARAAGGKNVYLSIDSRRGGSNPLFRLFKSCSFTDRDITLHFILFDILSENTPLSLSEITQTIEQYTADFDNPMQLDESGVRKKLAEYERLGLVRIEKNGRTVQYFRAAEYDTAPLSDALEFFSETGCCGVIGSFIRDKQEIQDSIFEFKHNYITHTLDSEILCGLLCAISGKRQVEITHCSPRNGEQHVIRVIPLKIFVSAQNGRRWLMAYSCEFKEIMSYRIDYIECVTLCEESPRFDELRNVLTEMQQSLWGVVCSKSRTLQHVEFTVYIGDGEEHIYRRLIREKRCGTVERTDEHTARFTAEVQDACEMIPWIRTFIGRIIQLDFSDRTLENMLRSDIEKMYEIYGIGGEENAVP